MLALLPVLGVLIAAPPSGAAYPGVAGEIAFSTQQGGGVRTVSPDTRAVSGTSFPASARTLSYSADGSRVAYMDGTDASVWVANADGSSPRKVAPYGFSPSISPDGRQVAYSFYDGNVDGRTVIHVVSADGTGGAPRVVTPASFLSGHTPAWSPSGAEIAFGGSEGRFNYIYVVRPDGSGLRQVTQPTNSFRDSDSSPNWSPDGNTLVYLGIHEASEGTFEGSIYTVDAAGGTPTLIYKRSYAGDPEWSPDGRRIVFADWNSSPFSSDFDLFTVAPDGSDRRRLTTGATAEAPAWRPVSAYAAGHAEAGGTVSTGSGTSSSNPLQAAVTIPGGGAAGNVSLSVTSAGTAPSGFAFFRREATITAPDQTVSQPLRLSFEIDASLLNGTTAQDVQILRDGSPAGDCTSTDGSASPDPCVASRTATSSGGVLVTVRSSHASRWNVGRRTGPAYQFNGFFAPIDSMPVVNSVKAGSAVPVRFGLGGDYGLDVFAADYPKSVGYSCDSGAPTDDIEETVNAGSSALSYDRGSGRYMYVWKTPATKGCRELVLRFKDGTERRARFRLR